MTRTEFLEWIEFHALYPIDDLHRIHRPAALVAQSLGGGGDMSEKIDFLTPNPRFYGMSEADIQTMKAFGIGRKG